MSEKSDDTATAIQPSSTAVVPVNNRSIAAYKRAQRGTSAIMDIGAKARALSNLKQGRETIRTDEIIDAIVRRLLHGEFMLSICTDPDMPGPDTVTEWMKDDPELRALITWARAEGANFIHEARADIVGGGYFSTGDKERDFELARVLKDVAAVRNRATFGDKVEVTKNTINYVVTKSDADW